MTDLTQPLIPAHQLDDVLAPIEEATGMPNAAYVSEAFFTAERDEDQAALQRGARDDAVARHQRRHPPELKSHQSP